MAILTFLAMTGAEISKTAALPPRIAWMACHFSPSDSGLSDLPSDLPAGSMIVLDDQLPLNGHDPERIARQLSDRIAQTQAGSVLLDFQRPDTSDTRALVRTLVQALPCPVGVPPQYTEGLCCPVFLAPVPPSIPLDEYLRPWSGREIWLEMALDASEITVTSEGSVVKYHPFAQPASGCHRDERLHCHYRITAQDDLRFYLFRTREDAKTLLAAIDFPNVKYAIALFQEFK